MPVPLRLRERIRDQLFEHFDREGFHRFGRIIEARTKSFVDIIVIGTGDQLAAAGVKAMAPSLSPLFEVKQSERYTFASSWSERNAAHAQTLLQPSGLLPVLQRGYLRGMHRKQPRPFTGDEKQATPSKPRPKGSGGAAPS
jgi:hypothetical protein